MFRRYAKGGFHTPEFRRPTAPPHPMPKDNKPEAVVPLFYATRGLRTCEVDGKPALFHRWADEDKGLLKVEIFAKKDTIEEMLLVYREKDVVPSGCTVTVMRTTFAIVEYPDGSVHRVPVDRVRFTDREENRG